MAKFIGFENDGKSQSARKDEDTSRSEFVAHTELHEGVAPWPVLEAMRKYNDEIVQSDMDIRKTQRFLTDEYQVLVRMVFSKEEIENELERRIRQLIPRKR